MVYKYATSRLDTINAVNQDPLPETDEIVIRPPAEHGANTSVEQDLWRQVYCVLGMPLDAVNLDGALAWTRKAVLFGSPRLLSTPNLNFLVNSLAKKQFRDSLLLSDLSIADGMPLIWVARLLGLPIRGRVAGSELFDRMVRQPHNGRRIKVFLFGGADGVAEKAAEAMNASSDGVRCVGTLNPGFGTIDDMSSPAIIERINASGADFLVVALGAQKGQEWLLHNHERLTIPLRAHLGACMNFQAGTVVRAPRLFQKSGLEWLWRIKEEPQLWRRYRHDGLALIRLMITRVLPLALQRRVMKRMTPARWTAMEITARQAAASLTLFVKGHATEANIGDAITQFASALGECSGPLTVDLSGVETVDQRFLGLLMMVRKQSARLGIPFHVRAGSQTVRRAFRLNAAEYLLSDDVQNEGARGVDAVACISPDMAAGDARFIGKGTSAATGGPPPAPAGFGINERYINAFNFLQFRLIAFSAMSKSIHSKSVAFASMRLLETRIMRILHSTFSITRQQFAPAKDSGRIHGRIDSKTFRQVMREVASPVAVVASGEQGERSGLTATAICSVSDNPPTVLVCVNQNAIAHGCIIDRGIFSINFLSSDQEDIAILFSGANKIYGEDRFALGDWERGATGAPLLRNAICNLECQLVGHQAVATHTVFIGELISGHKFGSNGALLYQHGSYKRLASVRPGLELAGSKS